ncbi:MAG TPA: hypothetical protein VLI92_03920 [Candidatus Saccharimonadales bacterium]|nr:hypothetical protein [Candidatus Saccharimonadales bacterium]
MKHRILSVGLTLFVVLTAALATFAPATTVKADWATLPFQHWLLTDAQQARQVEFDKFIAGPQVVPSADFTFTVPANETLIVFVGNGNCAGHSMNWEAGTLFVYTSDSSSVSCSNISGATYAYYMTGETPNVEALAGLPLLDSQPNCGYDCIKVRVFAGSQWHEFLRSDMLYAPWPSNPPPGYIAIPPHTPTATLTPTATNTSTPTSTTTATATQHPVHLLYLPLIAKVVLSPGPTPVPSATPTAVPVEPYFENHCGPAPDGVIGNYTTTHPDINLVAGLYGTYVTMDSGLITSGSGHTFTVPSGARALVISRSNLHLSNIHIGGNGNAQIWSCSITAEMPDSRRQELTGAWSGEVWDVMVDATGAFVTHKR